MADLDPTFLSVLACPACDSRPPLRPDGDALACDLCGRRYPIRDGVPSLLMEDAEAAPGEDTASPEPAA